MTECRATLRHAHGVAVCDLAQGHDGQHGAWCDICMEAEEDARLYWDRDGENWLNQQEQRPVT